MNIKTDRIEVEKTDFKDGISELGIWINLKNHFKPQIECMRSDEIVNLPL